MPFDIDQRTRTKIVFIYPYVALCTLDVYQEVYVKTGLLMSTVEGLRTWGQQDDDYKQGRFTPGPIITNAKGGESEHNFGIAVDSCFRSGNGYTGMPWDRFDSIAIDHGFGNGEFWKKICDKDHIGMMFETDLATLRLAWKVGGLSTVFSKLDSLRGAKTGEDWKSLAGILLHRINSYPIPLTPEVTALKQ